MAVGRQLNVKGQMRIDVPHLRLIESGVVYDFDTLAGGILAGKLPYVVTGFVPATWVNGSAASSLSLVTADGIFVNYQASENGSMLMVPADRAPEQLSITNSRVSGNFTVSQTNYVSLDLTRTEDATTSDVVHFIDPATGQGTPKIIPLGRTMDYQIHITTSPFSTNPQRCPVMIVVTDAANNIVSVEDARPMMFRLAAGGDTPDALSKYAWPEGRNVGIDPVDESANFTGGDKAIGDMKSWISAITEMIWQINAGEYWYSNTQMTSTWFMPSGTNVWSWNLGTETVSWSDALQIVFTGSTAMYNTIAAGSAVLAPDTALYVDFNRYVDGTVLVPATGPISTLNGEPATPGIRYPIAWRVGTGTPAIRNLPVPAGSSPVGLATTTTAGSVFLNTAAATPYAVVSNGLGGSAIATGLLLPSAGALNIGTSANETSISIGGGVNNQSISIGFASATLGSTFVYGKTVVIGASTSTAQMNTAIAQVGCTTGATISIGVNSDATVNINTGASAAATTAIGTAAVGTVQIRAATININDSGASADTTIGHTGAGATLSMYGSTVYINNTTAGVSTIIGNGNGGTNTTLYGNNMNLLAAGPVNINTNGDIDIHTSSAANPALQLYSAGRLEINVSGTGATVIGNATSKAAATAATVAGDPALTLVTKGYAEAYAGGAPSWVALTPGSNWINNSARVCIRHGIVYLDGQVEANTGYAVYAFTLGATYLPATQKEFIVPAINFNTGGTSYMGFVTIDVSGNMTLQVLLTYASSGGSNIGVTFLLDGISFPTW